MNVRYVTKVDMLMAKKRTARYNSRKIENGALFDSALNVYILRCFTMQQKA